MDGSLFFSTFSTLDRSSKFPLIVSVAYIMFSKYTTTSFLQINLSKTFGIKRLIHDGPLANPKGIFKNVLNSPNDVVKDENLIESSALYGETHPSNSHTWNIFFCAINLNRHRLVAVGFDLLLHIYLVHGSQHTF